MTCFIIQYHKVPNELIQLLVLTLHYYEALQERAHITKKHNLKRLSQQICSIDMEIINTDGSERIHFHNKQQIQVYELRTKINAQIFHDDSEAVASESYLNVST